MLASDSCVKCITEDGSATFTSDPEHLLQTMDIEHPAGDLVLKALQSHKNTFGTGTKTLLFMLASLAKAVVQLSKLGIHSDESLEVIRNLLADLIEEIQEISLDINHCIEHNTSEEILQLKTTAWHGTTKTTCRCSDKEILSTYASEMWDEEITCIADGDIQEVQCALTNPVHLKMSNLEKFFESTDDIDWYFDKLPSHPDCAIVNSKHVHNHGNQHITQYSDMPLNCFSCSGPQDYRNCQLVSQLSHLHIKLPVSMSKVKDNSKFDLQIGDCVNRENRLIQDVEMNSLLKDVQHSSSSDFENCFDEYDNYSVDTAKDFREHDSKANVLRIHSNLMSESNSSSDFSHNLHHQDPKLFMTDNQLSIKHSENHEFYACLSDFDVHKLSMACEHGFSECEGSNSLELLNNIQQSILLPEHSRGLCDVLTTHSNYTDNRKDKLKESMNISSSKFSKAGTDKSKFERFNTTSGSFKSKMSYVELLKSSRHLHLESEENMYANSTVVSNTSFINLMENTKGPVNLEDTIEHESHLHSEASSVDISNTMQEHHYFDSHETDKNIITDSFTCVQEHSEEVDLCDKRKTASHPIEVNNGTTRNTDRQMLLDQLLLEKKTKFRSSIAEKIMLSSRHFTKVRQSKTSCSSELHENSRLKECSSDGNNVHISDSNNKVAENSFFGYTHHDEKEELGSVKDSNSFVHKESVAVLESSDDILDNSPNIQDHHLQNHTSTQTLDANSLESSIYCSPAEILCSLSGVTKEPSCSKRPETQVINYLHDCKSDVGDVSRYIFHNQIQDKENGRFNFNLVSCLLLPSLTSLPSSFTSGWKSSTAPVSVVPGLIIPCHSQIFEMLHTSGQSIATLLINGDLTVNFHHKGYLPTLPKKTLIAKPQVGSQEFEERLWCSQMLDILIQLNVKLLLVKGKASSILVDMCEASGVLLLTDISYRTLNVLSYLHKVDIVTYLTLASEANLCTVFLQPLSAAWMDCVQEIQLNNTNQYAVITKAHDVQTAVIHCSNMMSAQLLEEKLWKCLHSLANLQVDAKVLPGQGETEIWCANRIRYKSERMLCDQLCMQSVILEAVADVFHNYYRTVKLNAQFSGEEASIQTEKNTVTSPVLTARHTNNSCIPEHDCCSEIHCSHQDIKTFAEYVPSICGKQMKQSASVEFTVFESPEAQPLNSSVPDFSTPDRTLETECYDNFTSKISAWKAAVDIVSVLQSLGSLVISGIDNGDIREDMYLL